MLVPMPSAALMSACKSATRVAPSLPRKLSFCTCFISDPRASTRIFTSHCPQACTLARSSEVVDVVDGTVVEVVDVVEVVEVDVVVLDDVVVVPLPWLCNQRRYEYPRLASLSAVLTALSATK